MLYGIRRDLQASLSRDGHPFRVYVPFGKEWFPYFMRRLGERPANVGFVVRSLLRENRTSSIRQRVHEVQRAMKFQTSGRPGGSRLANPDGDRCPMSLRRSRTEIRQARQSQLVRLALRVRANRTSCARCTSTSRRHVLCEARRRRDQRGLTECRRRRESRRRSRTTCRSARPIARSRRAHALSAAGSGCAASSAIRRSIRGDARLRAGIPDPRWRSRASDVLHLALDAGARLRRRRCAAPSAACTDPG